MDKITVERIDKLHPKVRDEVKKIYAEICAALTGKAICRFAQGLRTIDEQNALFNQGRRGIKGEKIVTNARGGSSYHNYGLAIDIVLLIDKDGNGTFESASWETNKDFDADKMADWMEIVKIFKRYGWIWGGDFKSFKDYPHFEKAFGLSISTLKSRYDKKDFVNGYVRI